jgi:hypothetical protein
MKLELFFNKTLNDCTLRAQNRNTRADKKKEVGEGIFAPSLSTAIEFRANKVDAPPLKIIHLLQFFNRT